MSRNENSVEYKKEEYGSTENECQRRLKYNVNKVKDIYSKVNHERGVWTDRKC